MKKPIRVLHCPTSVGGNPQALARAERELGLQSIAVAFDQNYLSYTTDETLFKPGEHQLIRESKQWRLIWRILRKVDIVHYNFGSTIFSDALAANHTGSKYPQVLYKTFEAYRRLATIFDLPFLKRAGKKIVVTYQGDDARQGDFCRAAFEISPAAEVEPGYYTAESDERKRHSIARFERYADRIYALNPDLMHVLPPRAEFLPYANVDLREWTPSALSELPKRLMVLHAPTHRGAKGTSYILEAVKRLQEEDGLEFDFRLVEGISHQEARQLYERADLLIDQLLCGWYGGLAVEFMALGKPVICYLREQDLSFLPPPMRDDLPVINATPKTIYQVLKEWLTARRQDLLATGTRGRLYVERWHDPLKIAARLKKDYETIMGVKEAVESGAQGE
jgi:glycosyltransferase involved in cell wall biosynthesis